MVSEGAVHNCLAQELGQNIMVTGAGGKEVLHFMMYRKQSSKKGPRKDIFPRYIFPSGLLPPTRPCLPQFYHFLIVYSNFESIIGLHHSLGQRPHDVIFSGSSHIRTQQCALPVCWAFLNPITLAIMIKHHTSQTPRNRLRPHFYCKTETSTL
jgi:hypothetical protein